MNVLQDRLRPFEGLLLVSDMDGTLLDSNQRISQKNRDAIYAFTRGGGLFAVATGRNQHLVRPYLRDIPVNAPAILLNGALLYDMKRERAIFKQALDEDLPEILRELCEKFPGVGVEATTEMGMLIVKENAFTRAHASRDGFTHTVAPEFRAKEPWLKVVLAWEPQRMAEVYEWLRPYFNRYHILYSEPTFLDFSALGVSKGSCLERLMALQGIDREAVLAVGDYENDAAMLEVAGMGIAVGNACASIKAAADVICTDHDNDPLWDVVSRIACS